MELVCRLAKNCQTYAHSTKDWVHLPNTIWGGGDQRMDKIKCEKGLKVHAVAWNN